MTSHEDVPRSSHGLAGFARRVGALLTKGLTFSGQSELARWTPIAESRPLRMTSRLHGADRSDVRLMNSDGQFTPADLEVAIRRADDGTSER